MPNQDLHLTISKLLLALITSSILLLMQTKEVFAMCIRNEGNIFYYCRNGGARTHFLPDWYNQPIAGYYFLVGAAFFIALMLLLLFLIKYKKIN